MKTLYTTTVNVVGGREGHAESSDGLLKVNLALPKEMGGSGTATNPEQLFAAGYAACFEGAVRFLARQQKLPVTHMAVSATVQLRDGGGNAGFSLAASIEAQIDGLDPAAAEQLLQQAHQVCPYSKAMRGNVEVDIRLRRA